MQKGASTIGNLWYVYEGPNPTRAEPRCQLSFSRLQALFGKHAIEYLGSEGPVFSSPNPKLVGYKEPQFVVFELPPGEKTDSKSNRIGFQADVLHGFYKINVGVDEWERILASAKL